MPPQHHFKVGHPPPYSDVVGHAGPSAPRSHGGRGRHEGQGAAAVCLPPYRDVEEGQGADEAEAEDGGAAAYVMHPQDFEQRQALAGRRTAAVRRCLARSCDGSLALFFLGCAVVGLVLWSRLR